MHDLYLLLTPVLVLGVVALAQFVGCDLVWGVREVTSGSYPLVTGETQFGAARSDFTGWVGMVVLVGAEDINVDGLGRFCLPGNTMPHQVKIVDANTMIDVPNAIVIVSTINRAPNSFVEVELNPTVKLSANTSYYVLSEETAGQDEFYDYETTLTLDSYVPLTVTSPVYGNPTATPPILYDTTYGTANQSYGPVQIKAHLRAPNT